MKRLKFLRKLRCIIQKSKKCKIFWIIWGPCGTSYFTKLHLSPQTTLLDTKIIRGWKYITFQSIKSSEVWQKLNRNVKNWYILKFLSFLVANCAFFSLQNFVYFLKKPSWQPICSFPCWTSLKFEATKAFQSYTKTAWSFQNLNFFGLSILVRIWSFFQHQLLLSLQRNNHDKKLVPYSTSSTL